MNKIKLYIKAGVIEDHKDGTFVGMKIHPDTCKLIHHYCADNDIAEPVPADKLHVTVCYSEKPVPGYEVDGGIRFTNRAIDQRSWDIFGKDKNCLVLKIKSNMLNERHKAALAGGLTHTFPEFTPHVTFSYKADPDLDVKELPPFDHPIKFAGEYKEGVNKDYNDD